jgi:DNA-binding PadR family transcriptional regulator
VTRLTEHMRTALNLATAGQLRRVHRPGPGRPAWPAPAITLHALVHRGLLATETLRNRHGYPTDVWTITQAGREALKAPRTTAAERPVYLRRPGKNAGDYTTDPRVRIDDIEIIDDEAAQRFRVQSRVNALAERREQKAKAQRRTLCRRLREAQARAEREGVDITDELATIHRALEEIDRKRERAA